MAVVERWLRWYEKDSDEPAGEARLVAISLEELQAIFGLKREDPMYESFELGPEHARQLQGRVAHVIDLERHDYFIEADAAA